jgi:putative hydrolase of the HAD superfamily
MAYFMKHITEYKNIVFDMGCVLMDYDPDRSIRKYTSDPDVIREIRNTLFLSMEWLKLDCGLISEETAIERVLPRLSSDEARAIAEKAFIHWDEYNMWIKDGAEEMIHKVHDRGQKIYILSNASARLPKIYRRVMPAAELYDGVFFSAEYQCIKPQDLIYQTFFKTFHLHPEDCFFIDDTPENIEASRRNGMEGYVFSDGRIATLKRVLEF